MPIYVELSDDVPPIINITMIVPTPKPVVTTYLVVAIDPVSS